MDDKEKLVSVILPIYNVKSYIKKCMESLFRQTYSNLELIMVDDGSTDGCSEICDEYATIDSRVIVYHKTNGGLSDARNYGIERARGDFITCIDSDDYVDADYISYLVKLIEKYDTEMSICQHREQYSTGKIVEHGTVGDEMISAEKCIERLLYHDVIDTSAWAKLYKKELFLDVQYPKGKLFEDIATTYKLIIKANTIAVGYESKYIYNVRAGSIVTGSFTPNKFDLLSMTDSMSRDVEAVYPNLKDAILRRRVYARMSTLNQMLSVDGYNCERAEIIAFVKSNGKTVIKNPKTPMRDKVGIAVLCIGFPVYKLVWKLYLKLFK